MTTWTSFLYPVNGSMYNQTGLLDTVIADNFEDNEDIEIMVYKPEIIL